MTFRREAGTAPVSVARWSGAQARSAVADLGTHAHDFLVLFWVEHGSGPMRVDGRDWPLETGDAFLVAPGAAVAPPDPHLDADSAAWALFFPMDAVDPGPSWRTHPLLAPFAAGLPTGARRLPVPPADHAAWRERFAALGAELGVRRDGQALAVHAHLTLLLVALARLDVDVPAALADDPLLAAVFDVVERRFVDPSLSLRSVADAVALSSGHVASAVSARTGRSVGDWITERRMREARRLLAEGDLTVAAVARRSGYADPGYFVRRFRRAHGAPPGTWRDGPPSPTRDADPRTVRATPGSGPTDRPARGVR